MLKEQGSEARGREIKSRRERELEELRSRGVAKTRREKLKDFSAPLQTALETKQYFLRTHDLNRRDSQGMSELHPSTMSAVDYTSFLMAQTKRQRELKMRRREAEQLLHGFRGFYGESFASWSPRHAKKGRNSFGIFPFSPSDSLADPSDDSSRRQSTFPRLETEWGQEGRDDTSRHGKRFQPNPLDPHCRDFLIDDRQFDGTRYPRTDQDMEVSSGVSMFSPRADAGHRERPPSTTRSSTSSRNAFFHDPRDEDFDNQLRQKPPSTTQSSNSTSKDFFEDSNDAFSRSFERNAVDRNFQERKTNNTSTDFQSPYKERRMKLQINTEREEVIDVSASEDRLREAASHEEREGSAEIRSTSDDGRSEFANGVVAKDPIGQRTSDVQLSESVSQDETVYHDQHVSPVPITIWRNYISDEPGAKFPPEAGRYHLYASYACPGSHRALIVRALKGLEDVISVTIVHPTWRHTNPENPRDKHRGWIFGDPNGKPFHNTMGRGGPFPPTYPDTTPDPVLNAFSVRNLYEHAKDNSGKYTIPLLWDTKLNTIVNNESSDISYMLNSSFNDFAKQPDLDLYTEDDEEGLDRLNEVSQWLYPMMIHGVYRCGFAKTQRAYDIAIDELTKAFDAADELLQRQRYLTGDTLTDADIRFFVTLLRFDEVYAFYFRANTRLVLMTPSLLNFCREIYQMAGVANTCQMDQIKAHFFGSHAEWNKYSVVPRGLDFMRYLEMPHDREELFGLAEC